MDILYYHIRDKIGIIEQTSFFLGYRIFDKLLSSHEIAIINNKAVIRNTIDLLLLEVDK